MSASAAWYSVSQCPVDSAIGGCSSVTGTRFLAGRAMNGRP